MKKRSRTEMVTNRKSAIWDLYTESVKEDVMTNASYPITASQLSSSDLDS